MPMKLLALAAGVALLSGCVTTADLEKVSAEAKAARDAADRAQQTATTAQSDAAGAKASAARAEAAAQDAKSCCTDTNEKIDRMFKKSMYK